MGHYFTPLLSLSGIFVADFTLELRRSNAVVIETGAISLPPIRSTSDALYHVHQSIVLEMGDHESTSIDSIHVPGTQANVESLQDLDPDRFCISSG